MPSGIYVRKAKKDIKPKPVNEIVKPITNKESVFSVGDLVSDQEKIMKVILEVTDTDYKFVRLKEEYVDTTEGRRYLRKGEIATQPQSIFNKYHYLYQP